MNEEEALRVLEISDVSELQDAYDDHLFEFRQFLLQKVPFRKLIESRKRKLERFIEAFSALGVERDADEVGPEDKLEGDSLQSLFADFNSKRNQIKLMISSADSFSRLLNLADHQLCLYRNYALNWLVSELDLENVIASVEPDPMDITEAMKEHGDPEISEILNLPVNNPLHKELKRLNLWLKLDKDE